MDGIRVYSKTYVTAENDQKEQIHLGQEELKVSRIGHDATMK